jgi:hypothetical protein
MRRLLTTGAVIGGVLLIGVAGLSVVSFLLSVSRFTPYGIWSVLAVVMIAIVAGTVVWLRTDERPRLGGGRGPTLGPGVVLRAPPPVPARIPSAPVEPVPAGRLGIETSINQLVDDRRYDEALRRLAAAEQADPTMATFAAAKRRTIERRRTRGR